MKVKPRRPLNDNDPNGYLESDYDFVMNNLELCVSLLSGLQSIEEKEVKEEKEEVIDDPCPDCGAQIRAKELWEGGGVECSKKCGYWFCY